MNNNVVTPMALSTNLKACRTIQEVNAVTRSIYRHFDEALTRAAGRLACKKGCHYCCFYRVVVQPHEVFAIIEHLQGTPAKLKQVLSRAAENRKLIDQLTIDQHIATNIPCPFLEDGACSVYAVRPAKCRAYHSRKLNICEEAHFDTSYSKPHPYDQDLVLATQTLDQVATTAFKMAGLKVPYYELNGALIDVFSSGNPRKRWRDEKEPFANKYKTTV